MAPRRLPKVHFSANKAGKVSVEARIQRALLGSPWLVLSTSVVTVGVLVMVVWLTVRAENASSELKLMNARLRELAVDLDDGRQRVVDLHRRVDQLQESDAKSHLDASELFD